MFARFLLLLLISVPLFSATRTWDGGGASDDWSDSGNWDGAAPVAGDDLVFAGTTRLTPNNNIAAATSFASITFSSGAGAFVIDGNSITLTGSITNNDADTQTLGISIAVAAVRTVALTSGSVTINSVVSGAGYFSTTGSFTLTLGANNTATGNFTVGVGTTVVADSTTIFVNGVTLAVNGTLNTGNKTVTFNQLNGSGVVTSSASGTVSCGASGGGGTFSGTITGNVSLVKGGSGTQTLSNAASTYTGTTSVQRGTLSIASIANVGVASSIGQPSTVANGRIALGSGTNTGTLIYTGGSVSTDREISLAGSSGGGGITANCTATTDTLTFTATTTVTYPGSTTAKTLTLDGTANAVFAQVLPDTGANAVSLTKSGTGAWTLSATSTFTGATTLSAGKLFVNGATLSALTAASGSELRGSGTIGGAVVCQSGSLIAPGATLSSVGTLTCSSTVNLQAGSTYHVSVNAGTADSILATGTATLAGDLLVVMSVGAVTTSTAYNIVTGSSISGTFNGKPAATVFGGAARLWTMSYPTVFATITAGNRVTMFSIFDQ